MKSLYLIFATTVIALAFIISARGQNIKTASLPQADAARLEDLRKNGFDALYNLDYEEARRNFKEIARVFPEHPAGPQFLAASLWLQTLNDSRRLQSALYSTDAFYAKTEDKADPRVVEQFRELTREAKTRAEARLKLNARDTEALYFLGATEVLRAAFAGAVERRFISALREGSSGIDHHRDLLKLEPDFHDAEVSIGLYDYIVGGLPLPMKLLANLGGVRGSKRRGIEELTRAATRARFAKDDAKVMLIAVLKAERRYTEALAYARELAAKYPRNYLFKIEVADALAAQAAVEQQSADATLTTLAAAREQEAFGIFDALLKLDISNGRGDAATSALDLIHYRYGEALFTVGQMPRAAAEFLACAKMKRAAPGLVTMAHLRAAQSFDLARRRPDALAEYRLVLQRADVYDAHDEAKRGLREPFKIEKK